MCSEHSFSLKVLLMGKSIVSLIGASVLAASLPILPVSANSFHSHGATLTNGMNINAEFLYSGVYFLQMTLGQKKRVKKILVQR